METPPRPELSVDVPVSPEAALDAFRAHPEWDDARRDSELEDLIVRHPPERLRAAIGPRLLDLGGRDGEPVLRLLEALSTPELLAALAAALRAQPGLPPERAWDALALLDDAGLLAEHSDLAERWTELNETLAEDASLEELATQIEHEPEGLSLALQGLEAVEPAVRSEIIAGLAELRQVTGPNLTEFFRLLCFSHDPRTRTAALEALSRAAVETADPPLVAAWSAIAMHHPDPHVNDRARRWLGRPGAGTIALPTTTSVATRLAGSLVTPIDGEGQATIVLAARAGDSPDQNSAAFLCDVRRGVREVFGLAAVARPLADSFREEIAEPYGSDCVRDAPGLALGLLQGCLLLCGPETSPALRYWLEATVGPSAAGRPFPIPFPDWDPASLVVDEMAERAQLVLDACPGWIDASELTYDLAEELLLREGSSPPDPRRDRGVYRYLFEHRLRAELELYRRMLLWMASLWQATGAIEAGRSALALATQLADEQHAVPGHPFMVALMSRSLAGAQANLQAGIDPRQTGTADP